MASRQSFPDPPEATFKVSEANDIIRELELVRELLVEEEEVEVRRLRFLVREPPEELFEPENNRDLKEIVDLLNNGEKERERLMNRRKLHEEQALAEPVGSGKQCAVTKQVKSVAPNESKASSSTA